MPIFVIDEKWKDRLEKMWSWQRNFRASGDGVTFKNAPDGATVTVQQQGGKGTTSPALSPDTLIAKITGNADDPGDYDGRIRLADGTYPEFDDCLIRNTEESLSNGHGLRVGQELIVRDTGQLTDDDPPRRIVYVVGGEARTDTPTELPAGSGLTLDATEWNRDTSDGPVTWTPSRNVYDTTTHKLYSITRKPVYDARGQLYSVGPEVSAEFATATTGCP